MKVVSSIIMFIGLGLGFMFLMTAKSAPQEAISLVPIIGSYVLGRALENFSNKDDEVVFLLKKLTEGNSKVESKDSSEVKKDYNNYDTEEYLKLKTKVGKGELIIFRVDSNELSIITEDQHQIDKELHLTGKYKVLYPNSNK